jgi:hypothetical protein
MRSDEGNCYTMVAFTITAEITCQAPTRIRTSGSLRARMHRLLREGRLLLHERTAFAPDIADIVLHSYSP